MTADEIEALRAVCRTRAEHEALDRRIDLELDAMAPGVEAQIAEREQRELAVLAAKEPKR